MLSLDFIDCYSCCLARLLVLYWAFEMFILLSGLHERVLLLYYATISLFLSALCHWHVGKLFTRVGEVKRIRGF